jgi:hypothetical protein
LLFFFGVFAAKLCDVNYLKTSSQVSQEAIATSAEEVFQRLINIDGFNFSSVSQFAINNMGTLSSVLEQVIP